MLSQPILCLQLPFVLQRLPLLQLFPGPLLLRVLQLVTAMAIVAAIPMSTAIAIVTATHGFATVCIVASIPMPTVIVSVTAIVVVSVKNNVTETNTKQF